MGKRVPEFINFMQNRPKKLFVSCNPTLTSFYSKPHIFDQKNNVKIDSYQPTYPIFFRIVTGKKQIYLGLTISIWSLLCVVGHVGLDIHIQV